MKNDLKSRCEAEAMSVNQDEVESQLSAMFDGELPPAECELLSRRIDRDENLRARWSRYALIGAAMRCEPVATARSDFAARVSSAVDRAEERRLLASRAQAHGTRRRALLWQGALAAAMVGAVAGFSIMMLRSVTVGSLDGASLLTLQSGRTAGERVAAVPVRAGHLLAAGARAVAADLLARPADLLARQREAAATILGSDGPGPRVPAAAQANGEPWSYVTPRDNDAAPTMLRTELVDYIVAHSEYSTPLMRPDLLSALMTGGEEVTDLSTPPVAGAAGSGAPGAGGSGDAAGFTPAASAAAGAGLNATPAPAASNH